MRILFAAAEYAGIVKTGGLGDVCSTLAAALAGLGHDLRVLLPAYPRALDIVRDQREIVTLELHGLPRARLLGGKAPDGREMLLLDCPPLYRRTGGPYQDDARRDWPDNAQRFGLLSRAAALCCTGAGDPAWIPEILHCHDWHAALAPVYLRYGPDRPTPSLLTIHNLAFQGIFPPHLAGDLALPSAAFAIDGVEFFGNISFLKGGINCADWLTTVSPTYAEEILGPEHGCGLDGVLRHRRARLTGILNGIDTALWSPETDPHIARRYGIDSLDHKRANKKALLQRFRLPERSGVPLFAAISRLTDQKGIDLIVEIATQLARLPAQLVILGSGEPVLERALRALARAHPREIAVEIGFDEPLAHLIEAGADFFLMPSRFEPCGMNQMYSQRYGTPPVVRRTGGLADTVTDCDARTLAAGAATGFTFEEPTPRRLLAAIERAGRAFRDPATMRALQHNGMVRDYSWRKSASRYVEIYERLRKTDAKPITSAGC